MAVPKNTMRSPVDGFLNLYKPTGITSMEALRQVKRITGQRKKVGHGGTMDPLARGILPVCFGQATRLMDFVVSSRKRYRMQVELGVSTTTYDAEGPVVNTKDASGITLEAIETASRTFVGQIDQVPPMYSAIKVQGQRLYKLARAGIEVERQARPVEIYDIRLVDYSSPKLVLEVDCGRGAYMRSLAHDLGNLLGCGGHVSDLERLSSGGFHAEDSVTPDELAIATAKSPGWEYLLRPIDWVLRELKAISVSQQGEQHLRHGKSITLARPLIEATYLEPFRAYNSEGHFFALVHFERATNTWKPLKVFQTNSASPLAPVSLSAGP